MFIVQFPGEAKVTVTPTVAVVTRLSCAERITFELVDAIDPVTWVKETPDKLRDDAVRPNVQELADK